MKRVIVFLTVLCLSLSAAPALRGQESWPLDKCIRHAAENNLQVRQQMLAAEQARNNLLRHTPNHLVRLPCRSFKEQRAVGFVIQPI